MSTATDIINDARTYASSTYDSAEGLVSKAMSHLTITYPKSPEDNWPAINIDEIELTTPPSFSGQYNAPANTAVKPVFEDIVKPTGEIIDITPPDDFDYDKLWEGTIPTFNLQEFTKEAPTVSTVVIPDAPDLIDIPFPELTTVAIPEFNGVTIPSFDPKLLATIPDLPSDLSVAYSDTYASALPEMKAYIDSGMQEILNTYCPEYEDNRNRLINKINAVYDGGTGLDSTFEQNLYDRGRARAENEQMRLTEEIQNSANSKGHFTPPGATTAALVKAQSMAAMANAKYSSEVTIERAKMELQHLQFVMQLSNGIKDSATQLMVQHAGVLLQVNGQALEHAKVTANVMVENFNLAAKRFDLAMKYLSIQAQIYETEYKAALADLEVFRIEAEVAKLSNDINKTEVDIYTARLNSQEINLKVYIAQIEGINAQVKAELGAVSAFGEEVRAYATQVSAKEAEFGAYESALSGNKTQADIYGLEVRSYSERVKAEGLKQDVQVNAARTILEYNRNLSDQYQAELEAYRANIGGESARFDGVTKAYTNSILAFKAELDSKKATLEAQTTVAKLESDQATSEYQNTAAFRTDYARIRNEASKNVAQVAISGANVYTDIAAAALQSQNTMTQVVES